jgi:hypothetical protein
LRISERRLPTRSWRFCAIASFHFPMTYSLRRDRVSD